VTRRVAAFIWRVRPIRPRPVAQQSDPIVHNGRLEFPRPAAALPKIVLSKRKWFPGQSQKLAEYRVPAAIFHVYRALQAQTCVDS
jgi:hypothetical protein